MYMKEMEKLVEINREGSVMQPLMGKMNSERNPEERETPEHIVFLFNHWRDPGINCSNPSSGLTDLVSVAGFIGW